MIPSPTITTIATEAMTRVVGKDSGSSVDVGVGDKLGVGVGDIVGVGVGSGGT